MQRRELGRSREGSVRAGSAKSNSSCRRLQLTRGGRDQRLQTASLLAALACLGESPPAAAGGLPANMRAAYVYLRRLDETACRCLADAQVHRLPAEPLARERIALAMGARDWLSLTQELNEHRARVSRHFRLVVQGRG